MTERAQADPDRTLVEAAVAGDREAFGELVRRHQSRIVSLARAMTADDGDAEDLAQEAFVRAYRALGRFRGDSTFGTWLYRVALNVIRTHLGRRARRERLRRWWSGSRDETAAGGIGGADPPGQPTVAAEGTLEDDLVRRDAIDQALATLPEDLRVAITLRDIEGLEYREIARLLDVPIGTVESRIYRARQRLRPLLAPLVARTPGRPAADLRVRPAGSLGVD